MSRFAQIVFVPFAFLVHGSLVQAQVVEETAEASVFSGPQVGETLPGFKVTSLIEASAGQEFDPVSEAKDEPIVLVFLHELTRPGFGLMRAVTRFAASRKDPGMKAAVVFLTDDATKTKNWSKNVQRLFTENVHYGVSMEGKEGPGAYGLNRNVIATVLVGKQGKVTGNFALLQPQLQVDGPAIVEAIVAVTGGGKVPSMAELEQLYAGRSRMSRTRPQDGSKGRMDAAERDPRLANMLRAVINKQASNEEVYAAASRIEAYVANRSNVKTELIGILDTVVNSDRFSDYGTPEAQKVLKRLWEKYSEGKKRGQQEVEANAETSPEEE